MGLRARKKLATREALSAAAYRLAIEKGLVHVRVEDIAAEAGVSPRTYNNYFSSREAAICGFAAQRAEWLAGALRDRPAGESIEESLIAVMMEPYGDGGEPDRAGLRLMACSPALQGEYLKAGVAVERRLAEAIAERTGADVERDLAPSLLAAAVTTASRVAAEYWLRPETSTPYATILHAALRQVVNPPPANPTTRDTAC